MWECHIFAVLEESYAAGKKIIVLNVFIKKTQQTPEKNLRLAIQRAIKARLL